jgi:hypothetical protein
MTTTRLFIAAAILLCGAAACSTQSSGTATDPPNRAGINGVVESGTHPIAGSTVTLYATGLGGTGRGAMAIGRTQSSSSGKFFIPFGTSTFPTNLYVVAVGGDAGSGQNTAIGLGALAGTLGSAIPNVTINERSTVAMAFAFAQFSDSTGTNIGTNASNAAGLGNAALLDSTRLVNPATGAASSFFPSASACGTSSGPENCEGLERLNALSNALFACTSSSGSTSTTCRALLQVTSLSGQTTLAAVHAIALDPPRNAAVIYTLAKSNQTYAPSVAVAPTAWVIALKYYGNGKEFDGPGNIVFDAEGNLWISNNYAWASDPHIPACAGKLLSELTPLGDDAPGAPFTGGGIEGVGFGVTVDKQGNIWIGNFGFAGKGCTIPPQDQSAGQFTALGVPLSPSTGYTQGPIDRPQGTVTNLTNDIWFANFGNDTVTVYHDADPKKSAVYTHIGLTHPFGEAIDAQNRVWVTGQGSNNVALLNADGTSAAGSPFSTGITRPLGNAIDMEGDVWISNNGGDSVAVLDSSGNPTLGSPLSGGGIRLPWGIGVDGNDNTWVANFSGTSPRVSEICGIRGNCPHGVHPGQPITPANGYASALLQRLTCVVIDASGNVWVCDNWRRVPFQTNPGGDGLVEFVGLAGPVGSPAFGPVHRP